MFSCRDFWLNIYLVTRDTPGREPWGILTGWGCVYTCAELAPRLPSFLCILPLQYGLNPQMEHPEELPYFSPESAENYCSYPVASSVRSSAEACLSLSSCQCWEGCGSFTLSHARHNSGQSENCPANSYEWVH